VSAAAAREPPLDPDLASRVADADLRRRRDYLRRRLAEGVLCGSMKRITENELREAERELAERDHAD
jgi:hypothetical protein